MINKDKVKGMMYGLAIGDALGAPTEFMNPQTIKDKFGKVEGYIGGGSFGWAPGEWTDDTDQALMLARAVAGIHEPSDVNIAVLDFGDDLVDWSRTAKDIGNQTRLAINFMSDGYHPMIAGLRSLRGEGAGNGSIMRTAPVAVVVARQYVKNQDPGGLSNLASIFSAVTHAHPTACQTCEILVSVLSDFLLGGGYSRDTQEARFTSKDVGNLALGEAYRVVEGIKDGKFYPGGYCITTLAWGLWAADRVTYIRENFDLIFTPVNAGGDADTNAAVAGAVFGASLGFDALPKELVDGLIKTEELDAAIEKLLKD